MIKRILKGFLRIITENAAYTAVSQYVTSLPLWGKVVSVVTGVFTAGVAYGESAPLHQVIGYLMFVGLGVALLIRVGIGTWRRSTAAPNPIQATDFRAERKIGTSSVVVEGRAQQLLSLNISVADHGSGFDSHAHAASAPASLALDLTRPHQTTTDRKLLTLCWWHLQVLTLDQTMTAIPVKVFMKVGLTDPCEERQMVWSTTDGPQEEITLRWQVDPYLVPLAIRSHESVMVSGDPRRLRHFELPAWVTRFTDKRALLYQDNFLDMIGSVIGFRIVVRAPTGAEVTSPIYTIVGGAAGVRNGDLNGFKLSSATL